MIQELDLKHFLSMTWAEKIEWEKLGGIQEGLPEKLEEDDNLMHYVPSENWEAVHIEPETLDIEVEWFVGKPENQNH